MASFLGKISLAEATWEKSSLKSIESVLKPTIIVILLCSFLFSLFVFHAKSLKSVDIATQHAPADNQSKKRRKRRQSRKSTLARPCSDGENTTDIEVVFPTHDTEQDVGFGNDRDGLLLAEAENALCETWLQEETLSSFEEKETFRIPCEDLFVAESREDSCADAEVRVCQCGEASFWGCSHCAVYSSTLLLAHRTISFRVAKGPPGLQFEQQRQDLSREESRHDDDSDWVEWLQEQDPLLN